MLVAIAMVLGENQRYIIRNINLGGMLNDKFREIKQNIRRGFIN